MEPPPHRAVLERWLALGLHGSMAYLEDPRRSDPRLLLEEGRSILVVAARYPNPGPPKNPGTHPNSGEFSAYAWGKDYHKVLTRLLHGLVEFIQAEVGRPIPSRVIVDSGPLMERDLAQRAGLGWIGRNTCLIHPRIGSYFFLAEVLLGLELPPDPPFEPDRCGSCQRCVQACPTGCILPDRTIDARRCISYLTIENKGDIPLPLRPLVGDRVFGCDLCQQVCPWNRRAGSIPLGALQAPIHAPQPDLLRELALTEAEFQRMYRESPLLRARFSGYRRNLAVALGNSGNRQAAPLLQQAALHDPAPVAVHAAWALERILPR